jgi:4-amino-4-deoxy-L-arabinose transferase-like glycosyltransferase
VLRGRNPRDILALTTLCLAGVGIPLWFAVAAGTVGNPSNDDWVYMRAAASLFRTGRIDMPGHTTASVGQLVLVQPFLWLSGGSPWAFTAFGLFMALIGVVSTFLLARRFVGTGAAVMVALLIVAFPGFVRESATFMTDVPAYALSLVCLLLGTSWLRGEGRRVTLLASLGAGVLAVSIREFAIAAPAAILVAAWARSRANQRVWLATVSGTFGVAVVGVLVVAASLPGHGTPLALNLTQIGLLGPAFSTLSAVVLPAAVLGIGRRTATMRPEHLLLGAAFGCLVVILPGGPLVGQLWMANGLVGDALLSGTRDAVIGWPAWALSEQLAAFAAILVAALALRWVQGNLAQVTSLQAARAAAIRVAQSPEAPLVLFLIAYAGELAVLISFGYFPLDRYLYPMVPPAAILLLRATAEPSRLGRRHPLAHASFVWLAASAFAIAANSFAYDGARDRAGDAAVALGYDARSVDAGYDWVGYQASGAANQVSPRYGLTWYDDEFMTDRPCAVVSNSPLDVAALTLIRIDSSAYRDYLFFGPFEPLYLYGSTADGCPRLPTAGVSHAAEATRRGS